MTDYKAQDLERGKHLVEAFIAGINADHDDVIPVGRNQGCLMRDYIDSMHERIAKLEALVSEYRSDHAENLGCNLYTRTAVGVKENDCRCDSCRRADELKG